MSKNRKARRPSRSATTSRAAAKPARRASAGRGARESGSNREIVGVLSLGGAIFLLAALISLQAGSGVLMGPFGRTIAQGVYGVAGICSYALAAMLAVVSVRLLMARTPLIHLREVAGLALGLVSLSALVHLGAAEYRVAGHPPGGVIGEHVAEVCRALISTAGTALLATIGLIVAALIATPLRIQQISGRIGAAGRFLWAGLVQAGAEAARFCGEVLRAILPERDSDEYDDDYADEVAYDAFAHEGTDPSVLDPPIIAPGMTGSCRGSSRRASAKTATTDMSGDTAAAEAIAAQPGGSADAPSRGEAATPAITKGRRKRQKQCKTLPAAGDPAWANANPGTGVQAAEVSSDHGDHSDGIGGNQSDCRDHSNRGDHSDRGDHDDGDIEAEIIQENQAVADAVDRAIDEDCAPQAQIGPKATAKAKPKAVIVADAAAQAPDNEPVILESKFARQGATELRAKEKQVDAQRLDFIPLGEGTYQLPPVHLLDYNESQNTGLDRAAMLELSARLTTTLENYGVKGEVVAIRPGPVVTMYEFAPAPGTRVSKIANLSDDLAMALAALRVRIVAPIPGKAAVGIEVPNKARETVFLKEVIADDTFQRGKHKLPLAVGKDIEGAPSVVDLAKMPHLLVAGTTGSGKSVSVNSMITSLLYCRTPEEVRMIMVDPKMLELSIYEGIPHLLLPVVTDPKKANLALRWGVDEMERRYDLLASTGVRDLASYNQKMARLRTQYEAEVAQRAAQRAQQDAAPAAPAAPASDVDQSGAAAFGTAPAAPAASASNMDQSGAAAFADSAADIAEPPPQLPYIVIIIDEFADLMMCAPKEVETSVARIAQKARAAGIHLLLATQRPSVDVITGLIKANFPSRAAFRVTSKVDSRTILDQSGAENLLGAGDMLFSDRGTSPCRYHGCFVGDEAIGRVVAFLKEQGRPVYNLDILKPREDDDADSDPAGGDEPMDEMYDRAVALVAETRQVSISMIQRRLRVGYNRAARMVEQMEREGVVSSPDHTNKREVLVQPAA